MEKKTGKTYYCAKCNCYPHTTIRINITSKQYMVWDGETKSYKYGKRFINTPSKVVCGTCGFKLQEM